LARDGKGRWARCGGSSGEKLERRVVLAGRTAGAKLFARSWWFR
jgi:hypothetical protein